jgi:hypothetical protein
MAKKRAVLPPLTTELALIGTWLQISREEHGQQWCVAHGIGEMRRRIIRTKHLAASASASDLLRKLCEICPHKKCPMKRE